MPGLLHQPRECDRVRPVRHGAACHRLRLPPEPGGAPTAPKQQELSPPAWQPTADPRPPPGRRRPNRTEAAMNHSDTTEHLGQRAAEELVSWTGRERLRFLWYRLRLTVAEMNYATRRMVDLRMRLP
jgi:hypothetical protein